MYKLWETGHIINRTVMQAFKHGLATISESGDYPLKHVSRYAGEANNISYGILRGTGEIFQKSTEYWEIDRGYFGPHHFDGFYRITKDGTFLSPLGRGEFRFASPLSPPLPRDRLDALKLDLRPFRFNGEYVLLCPPTDAVARFYGIDVDAWIKGARQAIGNACSLPVRLRIKSQAIVPLRDELPHAACVVTFNSTVALDALQLGIPAFGYGSSPFPSLVYPFDGLHDWDAYREALFRLLSYSQFTLDEFRTGRPWEIVQQIQKYGESPNAELMGAG